MAEILSINREKRAHGTLQRLNKRRRLSGKFDFTIIVGDQAIYADQNILASGSDYFDAMLSHDTRERENGEVEMNDVDFESVKTCIDHIYGEKVSVTLEKCHDLMCVATMLQLDDLCDAIEEHMTKKLTVETFFAIHNVAAIFELSGLINLCMEFASKEFEPITREEKFYFTDKSFMAKLLTAASNVVLEERKLEILLEWVRFYQDRKVHLLELLKCIDVSKIPEDVGQSYIENETLINMDRECLLMFSLAIIKSMQKWSKKLVLFAQPSGRHQMLDPENGLTREICLGELNNTYFSVVRLKQYIYVLGRDKMVQRLNCCEFGASWLSMPCMNKSHGQCPPATVQGGCIYVIGGHNECATGAVERYSPEQNKWELLQDKTQAIQCAEVLGSGRYIYSFGGIVNSDFHINDVTRLDVMTSQWEMLSSMTEKKAYVSAAEYENMIFVAGGTMVGAVRSELLEMYDPCTDQWSVLPEMNVARSYFNLHAVGDVLYAVGGYASSPRSIETYNINERKWEMAAHELSIAIACSVVIET